MYLRLTGAILVLLGLAVAGSGIASATLWRPADHVQAEAIASGATTLLVTDPGVLELVSDSVTVRASGPSEATVVLAVGREADVRAWVALDAHTRVTGLADAATLAAEPGQPFEPPVAPPAPTPEDEPSSDDASSPEASDDASPDDDASSPEASDDASPDDDASSDEATDEDDATADDATSDGVTDEAAADESAADESAAADVAPGDVLAPDPTGSDMWVVEVRGDSTAELEWTRQPGRWSLLVASTGPAAGPPTLELTWPREVVTPWFLPGLWIGAAIAVVGLGLLGLAWYRGRASDDWTEIEEPQAAAVVPVPTGPLTRRQLRELEAAQAASRPRAASRRGRRDAAGGDVASSSPAVPGPVAAEPTAPPATETATSATDEPALAPLETSAGASVPSPSQTPFVPTFEPRHPGGIVPHVPATPAVPAVPPVAPSWPSLVPQPGPDSVSGAPATPAPWTPAAPGRAEPDRAEPDRAEPDRAEPDRAAEEASRRSRTGKFFSRRRDSASAASAPAAPASMPERAPHDGAPPLGAQPATPHVAPPGDAPQPGATSGTASADAWRARWGFVELPPSPEEPDEDPTDEEGRP